MLFDEVLVNNYFSDIITLRIIILIYIRIAYKPDFVSRAVQLFSTFISISLYVLINVYFHEVSPHTSRIKS